MIEIGQRWKFSKELIAEVEKIKEGCCAGVVKSSSSKFWTFGKTDSGFTINDRSSCAWKLLKGQDNEI